MKKVFIHSVSSVPLSFTAIAEVMILGNADGNKQILKCDVNSGMLSSGLSQVKSGEHKFHSAPAKCFIHDFENAKIKRGGVNSIQFAQVDRKDALFFA